jgi:WD40 repeat protein
MANAVRADSRLTSGVATSAVLVAALILVVTLLPSSLPGTGRLSTAVPLYRVPVLSVTQAGVLKDPDEYWAYGIAFSPDGKTIAASFQKAGTLFAQNDPTAGHLDLWNVATRELTGSLPDFDGGNGIEFGNVAFDPADAHALAIADYNRVDLWNLTTNVIRRPSPEWYQTIAYLAYSNTATGSSSRKASKSPASITRRTRVTRRTRNSQDSWCSARPGRSWPSTTRRVTSICGASPAALPPW